MILVFSIFIFADARRLLEHLNARRISTIMVLSKTLWSFENPLFLLILILFLEIWMGLTVCLLNLNLSRMIIFSGLGTFQLGYGWCWTYSLFVFPFYFSFISCTTYVFIIIIIFIQGPLRVRLNASGLVKFWGEMVPATKILLPPLFGCINDKWGEVFSPKKF